MLAASNGTSAKDNTANWNGEMRVISRFIDDALASPGAAGFFHSIYSRARGAQRIAAAKQSDSSSFG